MSPGELSAQTSGSAGQAAQYPALRASDRDRDDVTRRLQDAFAAGMLNDGEFDERVRAALTASTMADLAPLTADLPAGDPGTPGTPAAVRTPGRFAVAMKTSIRRSGRWRVPGSFTPLVYKGTGWIDLRAAELTDPVTTVTAVAYKSQIDILVPPGVRVELGGLGVSHDESPDGQWPGQLPASAPVVHVRGFAYKSTVQVSTRPPQS
jgi:hypothetical protein